MVIRELDAADAAAFQMVRLAALAECPTAFASSVEEERDVPLATIGQRLTPRTDRCVFGAFRDGELIGLAGLARETPRKLAHKAFLWGVYVAQSARRAGVGRLLMVAALDRAARMPGVQQVNLGVNVDNSAAIALYERFGFRSFGIEKTFMLVDDIAQDEYHMVLVLPRQSDRPPINRTAPKK